MLDLIEWRLRKGGVRVVKLDGSMSVTARSAAISAFMTDPSVKVILISLKAVSRCAAPPAMRDAHGRHGAGSRRAHRLCLRKLITFSFEPPHPPLVWRVPPSLKSLRCRFREASRST